MKKIFYIALTALGVLLSTSCEREKLIYDLGDNSHVEGITGTLDLSDFDAALNDAEVEQAKAPLATRAVDTRNFMVEIYRIAGNDETIEHSWTYSETPEIVILNIGDYKLKVYSHEVQAAEWEKPYYYAEKSFTIEEGKVTSIESIVCTLQNIKVTVAYTDDLKMLMGEDCHVVLTIGEGELTYGKEEQRAGYFRADNESNQLIAVFTGNIEGREEVSRIQIDDVAAGEWRKITYDIKRSEPGSEWGNITPSVTVNASCTVIDINENITIEEDVIIDPNPIEPPTPPTPPGPGEDGDEDKKAPEITSTIPLGEPVVVTAGMEVKINVTSEDANGITGLTVDIESNSLNPDALKDVGLDSHLDLVNPGSLKDALLSLEFPVENQVLNQTEVPFEITQFMALLGALGPDTHKFHITATDALGTTQKTLILVIE